MTIDIQILQLFVSIISAIGIGGILKWVVSVEKRMTNIETTCRLRNDSCTEVK